MAIEGRRVLVVGAARSGLAAAAWLASHGARVTLSPTPRTTADVSALDAPGVAIELGPHRAESFYGADLIVLSPGVSPWLPIVQAARLRGVPVIGELELASRFLKGRVVAITGTKGKSTTTTLVGRMCEAGGLQHADGREPRAAGERPDRRLDARHRARDRDQQLPARDDADVPAVDRGVAELLAGSPRPPRVDAEYRDAKARIFANQRAERRGRRQRGRRRR